MVNGFDALAVGADFSVLDAAEVVLLVLYRRAYFYNLAQLHTGRSR